MALRQLALATMLLIAARAADLNSLQPQGYVSDFAGVLDAQARADIERYCGRLERATGAQIAIVTIGDIGGAGIEDTANDLYRRWGIGVKGKDEGILLLLVVQERRMRLEVGRGLEPLIPDGMAGMLLDNMRPALRGGRYAEALGTAAHSIGERIATSKGVTIDQTYTPRRRVEPQQQREQSIPWPLVLGGLFMLLWLMSAAGRRRGGYGSGGGFIPGIILGQMLNRSSYGGYSGGGFGGYDSGDSFGGFGGGDSGGGGASSDW
jgi:uncharacterized protein